MMKCAALQFMIVITCQVRWPSEALPLSKFYPFGQSNGDQVLPPNDDGSSGSVPISIPFPFFDRYHDSLFVNTNGVISFLVQVSQYTPDAFPLGNDRRLMAPYWADADTTVGGNVSYRESTDPSLLQTATDDVIDAFLDHRKFQATWLYIATWDNVAFYGAEGIYTSERNTFQAVLITNGRHSFVIYNYNKLTWTTGTSSGGDEMGLGGLPAQAGFNAGDGIRYFNVPGSRTDQVLDLATKSNIGKPGQWMFRIDSAKTEGGGCNTEGSLIISPRSGNMLGGENIFIAGPCFNATDNIVCEFVGGKTTNGSYISNIRACCTVPMLNVTGRLPLKMSVNGGRSFDFEGIFSIVNVNRERPRVTRKMPQMWVKQRPVNIEWDPQNLGGENQTVSVQLARFTMQNDHVSFHSMFTLVPEQMNTGRSQFSVPKGQGDGTASGRFVTLVSVKKTGAKRNQSLAEWIWSDVFSWISYTWGHDRCINWHKKQPDPKIFTDDNSLLHCPQTFVQAMADRGRFMFDEFCNPSAEEHCMVYHAGATHCFRSNTPSNQGAGQQCCYNTQGNLMGGPNRGSVDRFHIDAGIPVLSHFFHDVVPNMDCCLFSKNCAKYFEKRPSDDGSKYEPPRPGNYCDPHMITLDEVEYTFNGYGEYRILEVAVANFALQGRLQPLTSDSGNQSKATVYKAFAMKESGSDIVQIHINGRDHIEVLVNGEVAEFDEQLMLEFNGVFVMTYVNTSKYSAVFNSGISVTVEKTEDVLQMMLLVPTIFKGNTSGLLGFWDGDQEKEFLLPNGTFLDTNSSHSTIHHEFGQLWVTTANESLFTYEEGKNHSSYFNTEYVPIFLDQDNLVFQNATLGQQARDTCGSNKLCLFDILTTGKLSIGRASKRMVEQFAAVLNETQAPGCIAIEYAYALQNVTTHRNDSNEGRVTYAFECHPSFLLNGSAVISCLRGKWNGSTPSCVLQVVKPNLECAPIKSLDNGHVRSDSTSEGSRYQFTCNDGFKLIGSEAIHCTGDGHWNGTVPKCFKVKSNLECPPIKSLHNGHVRGDGTSVGSHYQFTCNDGFKLIGYAAIYCVEEGHWNGTVPQCSKDIPLYIYAVASVVAVVVLVVVIVIIVVLCKIRRRLENYNRSGGAPPPVEMKKTGNENEAPPNSSFSFTNPQYEMYEI